MVHLHFALFALEELDRATDCRHESPGHLLRKLKQSQTTDFSSRYPPRSTATTAVGSRFEPIFAGRACFVWPCALKLHRMCSHGHRAFEPRGEFCSTGNSNEPQNGCACRSASHHPLHPRQRCKVRQECCFGGSAHLRAVTRVPRETITCAQLATWQVTARLSTIKARLRHD